MESWVSRLVVCLETHQRESLGRSEPVDIQVLEHGSRIEHMVVFGEAHVGSLDVVEVFSGTQIERRQYDVEDEKHERVDEAQEPIYDEKQAHWRVGE